MSRIHVPEVVEAFAVAGDVRTPYIAAGRGPMVVVLADIPSRVSALVAGLSRSHRVVAPAQWDPPARAESAVDHGETVPPVAHPRDFTVWIENFLDTLGLSNVFVVADAPLAADALGFVLMARDRVRGLAVLQHGHFKREEGGEAVSGRLETGVPICTIRIAGDDFESIARNTVVSIIEEADGARRD
jgi:hypothetical protein